MTEKHRPDISVIIPLYYAEEFVDALLQQLRTQPLEDIEIICVIDGSPDSTIDIVKRHAEADARIQWIYQDNAGAGAARNAGLERARGEYLAFLDADDLYDLQFLTKMYKTAETHHADLVVCQFRRIDTMANEKWSYEGFRRDRVVTNTVLSPADLSNPFTDFSVVPNNKLFRRTVVEKNLLRFSTTRVANDIFFALAMIVSSERIVALPDSLVDQRKYVNPQSITSHRAKHADDVFESFQDVSEWLHRCGLFDQYHDTYIEAWADAVHYNASFERNERFINRAAEVLATDEPWCSMHDKKLVLSARLDTGIISAKKFVASRQPDAHARALKLKSLQNEEAAIKEIVHLLNSQYGKSIPQHSSMLGGIIAHLKRKGIRHSVENLAHRLRCK